MRIIFSLILLLIINISLMAEKNIRTIYYDAKNASSSTIPESLIRRAVRNKYNYVIAEYTLMNYSYEWSNGTYIGNDLRDDLADAFMHVYNVSNGEMELIPLFQSGSAHSAHWTGVNNTAIEWNVENTIPAFSPNPNGMDKSFDELIQVINDAFVQSNVPGELDFIHIGHDEPISFTDDVGTLFVGQSTIDQNWIASNPPTTNCSSIELLMANEVRRRVETISAYLPNTRVMLYGDAYDITHNAATYNTDQTIAAPDFQAVRDKIVIIPWRYRGIFDAATSMNHFSSNNLDFIFGWATDSVGTYSSDKTMHALASLRMWQSAYKMPEFSDHCLGYGAFHWHSETANDEELSRSLAAMEYLSHTMYFNTPQISD